LISAISLWDSEIASGISIDRLNSQSEIVTWKQSFDVFFGMSLETFRAKHIDFQASLSR